MLTEIDLRLLWKFTINCGLRNILAIRRFEKNKKKGSTFPPFLFLSITNNCNLNCQGCWVSKTNPPQQLTTQQIDNIINQCKAQGSYFFGILGGEPLLHNGLLEIIAKHPKCYFQIFTNGTMLTPELAREFRRLGNVTPLISIEGFHEVSDQRRGAEQVYSRTIKGLENCTANHLITGVATSICQSNFKELVSTKFVNQLIQHKVQYLWYYIYRAAGPQPTRKLLLNAQQILKLRQFIVDTRCTAPIGIVDAYWNHKGEALCPAATGISHHINPAGDVEPCPPIQFAKENILNNKSIKQTISNSTFLANFRQQISNHTQGCILMEDPEFLEKFIQQEQAYDSSNRNTAMKELQNMSPCSGHFMPNQEIPEKHWLYRFAKKHWFFGFGTYG